MVLCARRSTSTKRTRSARPAPTVASVDQPIGTMALRLMAIVASTSGTSEATGTGVRCGEPPMPAKARCARRAKSRATMAETTKDVVTQA
ncbi:hypothetical protein shn_26535 (plasmid) [Shinella sp. HZN7]|nr:hypothetical protein shn_26535 [Shinella sp. HZN7]